jgi:hypothetical protein
MKKKKPEEDVVVAAESSEEENQKVVPANAPTPEKHYEGDGYCHNNDPLRDLISDAFGNNGPGYFGF